jgi:hypothetical protein
MMADEDVSRLQADLLTVKEQLYATRERESTAVTACRDLEEGRLTDRQKLQARVVITLRQESFFKLFDFLGVAFCRNIQEYTLSNTLILLRDITNIITAGNGRRTAEGEQRAS